MQTMKNSIKIDFLGPLTDIGLILRPKGVRQRETRMPKTSSSTMNQAGDNQTSESLSQRLHDGSMLQFFTVDRI